MLRKATLPIVVSCALLTGPIFAEEKVQPERQSTPGSSTPAPGYWTQPPGNDSTVPVYDEWRDRVRPDERPSRTWLVHGVVVLEDGSPPLEPIGLERVCEGTTLPEGTTDLEGRFTLRPGLALQREVDASLPTPLGPRGSRLGGPGRWACELRAVYPGYRSDAIPLGDPALRPQGDVGELVLHRLPGVTGETLSGTAVEVPRRARRAYAAGIRQVTRGEHRDAKRQFVKATRIAPGFAAAWYRLGHAHRAVGDRSSAREAWQRAVDSDADYLLPYQALALLDLSEQNWQGVADWSVPLLEKGAVEFPGAAYLSAVAQLQLGQLDAAELAARRSIELGWAERDPRAWLLHGVILDRLGRRQEAANELRVYLDRVPQADNAETVRTDLARLESGG